MHGICWSSHAPIGNRLTHCCPGGNNSYYSGGCYRHYLLLFRQWGWLPATGLGQTKDFGLGPSVWSQCRSSFIDELPREVYQGDRERGVQEPFVKDPARVIDAQELVVPWKLGDGWRFVFFFFPFANIFFHGLQFWLDYSRQAFNCCPQYNQVSLSWLLKHQTFVARDGVRSSCSL